jgi:hypothetical protein
MGARTRVRGWSGYSSADSLVSPYVMYLCYSSSSFIVAIVSLLAIVYSK